MKISMKKMESLEADILKFSRLLEYGKPRELKSINSNTCSDIITAFDKILFNMPARTNKLKELKKNIIFIRNLVEESVRLYCERELTKELAYEQAKNIQKQCKIFMNNIKEFSENVSILTPDEIFRRSKNTTDMDYRIFHNKNNPVTVNHKKFKRIVIANFRPVNITKYLQNNGFDVLSYKEGYTIIQNQKIFAINLREIHKDELESYMLEKCRGMTAIAPMMHLRGIGYYWLVDPVFKENSNWFSVNSWCFCTK